MLNPQKKKLRYHLQLRQLTFADRVCKRGLRWPRKKGKNWPVTQSLLVAPSRSAYTGPLRRGGRTIQMIPESRKKRGQLEWCRVKRTEDAREANKEYGGR